VTTIALVMSQVPDEFIPTRQSLLDRLRDWQDNRSWKEFFDTYWRFIYGVARKAGLSEAEAQDVVQDTMVSVARKLPGFVWDAKGSFKAWLKLVTTRRIADHFRKRRFQAGDQWLTREERLDTALVEIIPGRDPAEAEALLESEWQRTVMEVALERVKKRADPRQFQMFQLLVLHGLPGREVAQRLGAKLAEVFYAKYKVSALFKKQIKIIESRGF
jgi:RNA polymerase sigma-70 factor (ECF subfamily)